MTSTAATRAAKRDYWTAPAVVSWCRALDYSAALALMAALFLLGSFFN